MKHLVVKYLLALIAALLLAIPALAAGPKNLSPAQAQALVAREKKLVLLDVRTPEEYRQAHLRGALLIPLGELQRRLREIPRNRPVLVYCAVGARSVPAAQMLAEKGFQDVYHMTDGLVGWYRNGYPIER